MLEHMRIEQLEERLIILKTYLTTCLEAGDWHGVRECATDIEVTEAYLKVRRSQETADGVQQGTRPV